MLLKVINVLLLLLFKQRKESAPVYLIVFGWSQYSKK